MWFSHHSSTSLQCCDILSFYCGDGIKNCTMNVISCVLGIYEDMGMHWNCTVFVVCMKSVSSCNNLWEWNNCFVIIITSEWAHTIKNQTLQTRSFKFDLQYCSSKFEFVELKYKGIISPLLLVNGSKENMPNSIVFYMDSNLVWCCYSKIFDVVLMTVKNRKLTSSLLPSSLLPKWRYPLSLPYKR